MAAAPVNRRRRPGPTLQNIKLDQWIGGWTAVAPCSLPAHSIGQDRSAGLERASAFETHLDLPVLRLEERIASAQHDRSEAKAIFVDEPGGKQRGEQVRAAEHIDVLAVLRLETPDRLDRIALQEPRVVPRRLVER